MGTTDILVIGGGIIGASVAYGVAERGVRVALLDQGGSAPNASRGNFGLAWVQGKGLEMPRYAEWSLEAAQAWPEFATHLREQTGISTADCASSGRCDKPGFLCIPGFVASVPRAQVSLKPCASPSAGSPKC
jgi:glycine/D-amino acid oxidase-like deaminating enzyme